VRRMYGLLWLLAGAHGCAVGLGEPCESDAGCAQGLVCSLPRVEGGTAPFGVCDYPLKAEGEPCTIAAECQEELTCSNHFTPGTRYGTCVRRRGAGEPCFMDRDCVSGRCAGASGHALDGKCGAE
jgi:hypothetical protein